MTLIRSKRQLHHSHCEPSLCAGRVESANNFNKLKISNLHQELNISILGEKNSIRMVNQFVERTTNKTVQYIIMPWMLNKESNIILVNTIHFNNNWRYPFQKECTYRGDFFIDENETVEVE